MSNPQEVLRHSPVLGEAVLFCTGINDLAVSEYRHLLSHGKYSLFGSSSTGFRSLFSCLLGLENKPTQSEMFSNYPLPIPALIWLVLTNPCSASSSSI